MYWILTVFLVLCCLELSMSAKDEAPKLPSFKGKRNNFTATVGDAEVKLKCYVNAPDNSYYWFERNGKVIQERNRKYGWRPFRFFKIKKVEMSDAGDYVCVAKNKAGTIKRTIKLFVKAKDNKTSATPPHFANPEKMVRNHFVEFVGERVRMVCSAKGHPSPTVAWYKDGKPFTHLRQEAHPLPPHQFILTLKALTVKDSGVYTCNVSNALGAINASYTVDVREPVFGKPVLEIMENKTAHVGENVSVICKATSGGRVHFQWLTFDRVSKNLTVIRHNLREDDYMWKPDDSRWHGARLFLNNVTKKDENEYVCTAGNRQGYDQQSFFLTVVLRPTRPSDQVHEFQFEDVRDNFTATVGDAEVKLMCHVSAPDNTYYWFERNGKVIQQRNRKYGWRHLRFLKIKKVEMSDAGDYVCVAKNKAGTIKRTIKLFVKVTAEETNKGRNLSKNSTTGLIVLVCSAVAVVVFGSFATYYILCVRGGRSRKTAAPDECGSPPYSGHRQVLLTTSPSTEETFL